MLNYLKVIKKIADEEGKPIYLVGGFLRNLILKIPNEDIDLLVQGDPIRIARETAKALGGTFIPLDEENRVYRVVVKNNQLVISFDFTGFISGTLENNLVQRDFTVNSLALSMDKYLEAPESFYSESPAIGDIIDYTDGINDLRNRILMVNNKETFLHDPLRMLRAFRLAAIYDFKLSEETLSLIKLNAKLITTVSWERIRDEFFKILKCNQSSLFIQHMWEIGLLEELFPEVIKLNATEQNGYHAVNVWIHCLQALAGYESKKWTDLIGDYAEEVQSYLNEEITFGRSKEDLLKFTLLFHDCGKPKTKGMKSDGRITFYGHDEVGAKEIKKFCNRMVLSTKEKEFVSHMIKHHMGPLKLFTAKNRSDKAVRKFFRRAEPEAIGILLHVYADKNASKGTLQRKEDFIQLKSMIKELLEAYYQNKLLRQYEPILTGQEIIDLFNLPPGPQIGRIIISLEEEYIRRGAMTKEEAIRFCKKLL